MKMHFLVFMASMGLFVFAQDAKSTAAPVDEAVRVGKIGAGRLIFDPAPDVVPLRLNYQGFLTDDAGNALSDTATMAFRIFSAATGGTQVWSSGNQVLTVEDGVFHYVLSGVPLSVFASGDTRWLELVVRGQVLSPRTEITSTAWSYMATLADSAGGAMRIGGQDLSALDIRYVNNGENAGGDLSGMYPNPTVAKIQTRAVSNNAPAVGQILKWNGTQWTPANDTAGGADNDWIIAGNNMYSGVSGNVGIGTSSPQTKLDVNGVICGGTSDTVLAVYGAVLGGFSNKAGDAAVDTGAFVGGGRDNAAISRYSTVSGGRENTASDYATTVVGGYGNVASNSYAVVAGGRNNTATGSYSTVAGGYNNYALSSGVVGGGQADSARGMYAGIIAGYSNLAGTEVYDTAAVVCGGYNNIARRYSFVGGGRNNSAGGSSAYYATVAGGYADTSAAYYSFTVGLFSKVLSGHSNSAAFNGTNKRGQATFSGCRRSCVLVIVF